MDEDNVERVARILHAAAIDWAANVEQRIEKGHAHPWERLPQDIRLRYMHVARAVLADLYCEPAPTTDLNATHGG